MITDDGTLVCDTCKREAKDADDAATFIIIEELGDADICKACILRFVTIAWWDNL